MLIGPVASAAERETFRRRDRGGAARVTSPSRRSRSAGMPIYDGRRSRPAHIDLRPFVLYGEPDHERRARRPDARGAARGLARRQLLAGRRQQGHLGAARLMLSRVAESLYWTARYVERAEDIEPARCTSTSTRCSTRSWPTAGAPGASCSCSSGVDELFREHFDEYTAQTRDASSCSGTRRTRTPSSRASRARARTRAASREQISSEMWEHLNRLHLSSRASRPEAVLARAARLLRPRPRRLARASRA